MAWKKIDDYNSGATGTDFQPYSAFVAQGLTKNARAYPVELTRGACIPFRRDKPVRWASYGEPTGTVLWINCGANATRIIFRLQYQTATAHESDLGRIGMWYVKHLGTNAEVSVDAPSKISGGYLDIIFPTYSGGLQGYQAFFVGFQSDKLDNLGTVNVHYIDNNQTGLSKTGNGAGHYPVTTGEKFDLLELDPTTYVIQSLEYGGPNQWQIGFIQTGGLSPEGIGIVFPGETYYPVLSGVADTGKTMTGNVYELGSPSLYSVSYVVTETADYTPPDQFNHYHAVGLSSVNSAQTEAVQTFRAELANIQCDPYHFGRILTAEPDALTSTFCVQSEVEGTIQIAFTLFPIQGGTETMPTTIFYDVLDSSGASVIGGPVSETYAWNRFQPSTTWESTANQTRAFLGVFTGANEWGMRDGLPMSDILKGNQVFFELPSATYSAVAAGGVGGYTIKITCGRAAWIIAFSARLV